MDRTYLTRMDDVSEVRFSALIALILLLFSGLFFQTAEAEVYHFDRNSTVIGVPKSYTVRERESLIEIARKFSIGFNQIESANQGLDAFQPGNGAHVTVPASWVLPDLASYEGIVINLSEMRLYYFLSNPKKGSTLVRTFPIGIGREGFETPTGTFRIIQKTVNPSWHVPKSIREEKPELPAVVPPGPENPLGSHALRLSIGDVLIHGTNKPWGVGRRVSHGCIRLYPEDIPKLYDLVTLKSKVTIIRQPVKVGMKDGRVFIEVHKDEEMQIDYFKEAIRLLTKKDLLKKVSTEKLYISVREKRGMPVEISVGKYNVSDFAMK